MTIKCYSLVLLNTILIKSPFEEGVKITTRIITIPAPGPKPPSDLKGRWNWLEEQKRTMVG